MYKIIIYIEEYSIYQYFDGEKLKFSHDLSDFNKNNNGLNLEVPNTIAVISKNINFSLIKNNVKNVKKSSLNRYLAKYYKNESYFFIANGDGEYLAYHTLPLNIKKYYSLMPHTGFVIPYDYLVILFIYGRLINYESGEALLFIEKNEDIYKVTVIVRSFCYLPAAIFKEDMLADNLNILKAKLNHKNVKINKIVTNDIFNNQINNEINIMFPGADITHFNITNFFEFFEEIKEDISHFENIEEKFKKLEIKKNKTIKLYIAVIIIAIIFMNAVSLFFENKIYVEKQKLKVLNKRILVLSTMVQHENRIISFNDDFIHINVISCMKKFFSIFPNGVKIKNFTLIRFKNFYKIKGVAFAGAGYKRFVRDYNLTVKNNLILNDVRHEFIKIYYNFNKFRKPAIVFSGNIK